MLIGRIRQMTGLSTCFGQAPRGLAVQTWRVAARQAFGQRFCPLGTQRSQQQRPSRLFVTQVGELLSHISNLNIVASEANGYWTWNSSQRRNTSDIKTGHNWDPCLISLQKDNSLTHHPNIEIKHTFPCPSVCHEYSPRTIKEQSTFYKYSGILQAGGWYDEEDYDVVVVGAGHAGCEAALASARLGCKTLLLTLNLDRIAWQVLNISPL